MAIKRYSGDRFNDITIAKRFDGNSWKPLSIAKRFDGNNWKDLLSGGTSSGESGGKRTTAVFNIKSKTTYWGSGSKDNQYPNELIQGSYNNSSPTSRNTLVFFDNNAIQKAISTDAVIIKAELYIQRTASNHGTSLAYAGVKYALLSSPPPMFTGSGMKDAAVSVPTLNIGEGKWITLNDSVITHIKNGSEICFVLSSGNDYKLNKYIRYSRYATKLRITYSI